MHFKEAKTISKLNKYEMVLREKIPIEFESFF